MDAITRAHRSQGEKVKNSDSATIVERRVLDLLVVDEGRYRQRLRLQQRRLLRDFDGFLNITDGQAQIDREGVGGGQLHSGADEALETGKPHPDGDPSRGKG